MLEILAPYIGMAMMVGFVLFAWHMVDHDEPKKPRKK